MAIPLCAYTTQALGQCHYLKEKSVQMVFKNGVAASATMTMHHIEDKEIPCLPAGRRVRRLESEVKQDLLKTAISPFNN